ncbi:MAG TPA: hypothetical protein V6C78_19145 [Crinalium sp.]|jgi:hypothetical protein
MLLTKLNYEVRRQRRDRRIYQFGVIVSVMLSLGTGCTQLNTFQSGPSVAPTVPPAAPPPSPVVATPTATQTPPDPAKSWEEAQERAISAANLASSAQSKDDWSLVSSRWAQAIALLKSIPSTDSHYSQAQSKIGEFQRNLVAARQRANSTIPNVTLTAPVVSPSPEGGVAPGAATPGPTTPEGALAAHLSSSGAVVYTTSPCNDCQRQQDLFGQEAASRLTLVQCNTASSPAASASPDPCRQDNITTFPTWRINGQLYPGVQSLSNLADLSNYRGDRSFARQ